MTELEITATPADGPTVGNGGDADPPARRADDAAADELEELLLAGRQRRRWPWLVGGLAIGAGATVATVSFLDSGETADGVRTESVTLSTATVVTRDLVERLEYDAELSYGQPASVLASADGTITSIVAVGSLVGRGDVVADVDGEPVVAMIASAPFWRDIESGDEGDDVLALEANLAALGFDADGDMTVDGEYTSTTADAVEEWEESLGIEETGEVPLGRVVAVEGEATVVDRADLGSAARAGQELVTVQIERTAADVVHAGDGEVTGVPAGGTPVEHGDILWRLDGVDVVAIVEPDVVTEIVLDVMAEDDVQRLEETLVFFGFDPDGEIVVDDEGDLATIAAVVRWQEATGLAPTGTIGAQYYVVVPAGQSVVGTFVSDGEVVEESALFLTVGSPTLTATADVAADEIGDFDVGDALVVELVDGTTVDARLVAVADVADAAAGPDDAPTIEVTIELTGELPGDVVTGPVTALVEASRIEDAVVVPTRALVSLREGGFAVEVRDDAGGTRLVAVELGTFDDGVVEIVSGDVVPGDDVVVPS